MSVINDKGLIPGRSNESRLVQGITKIRVLTEAKAILKEGVEVEFQGKKEIVPADTVVIALGVQRNMDLEEALKSLKAETYQIGDCRDPRKALEAIHEGFKTACEI